MLYRGRGPQHEDPWSTPPCLPTSETQDTQMHIECYVFHAPMRPTDACLAGESLETFIFGLLVSVVYRSGYLAL
jgi:hypothetical protein